MPDQSRFGNKVMILLPCFILFLGFLLHTHRLPDHDVTWFAWGAREWLNGAVIGRDVTDPNFPLAYLLYLPAIFLSHFIPFTQALYVYPLLLTAFIIFIAWDDVPSSARLPIFSMLAFFVGLNWPREFAQREELVMLLVFPYVLPVERRGWRAIVTGVLAGIGFAVKPFFLIPWLLLEIKRKPFRSEQLALMATGAIYAVSLLVFFPVFTFHQLPITSQVYGAFNNKFSNFIRDGLAPTLISIAFFLCALKIKNKFITAFSIAAIGFNIVALIQMKFYIYQFLATYGFIMVGATAMICLGKKYCKILGGIFLVLAYAPQIKFNRLWYKHYDENLYQQPLFLKKLQDEGAHSFAAIDVHPYPVFPTVIYAREQGINFVGSASSYWYLPAAAKGSALATQMSQQQLLNDLRKKPDVIIVDTDWRRHTHVSRSFNGLALLLQDPLIAQEWAHYVPDGAILKMVFYKRLPDKP